MVRYECGMDHEQFPIRPNKEPEGKRSEYTKVVQMVSYAHYVEKCGRNATCHMELPFRLSKVVGRI